jgi:hypothetical protein
MMQITEEIREKLREPMPPEAISQHPTKSFLSTIKAIYIVERLNDVFGIGGWCIEHEIVSDEPDYVSMKGKIIIHDPVGIETPWQYGGHGKTGKNTEPADGYKSAVTDCQSKCASYLEIGIDVFKGLVDPPKGKAKKQPPKTDPESSGKKEMSPKQWSFIEKCGKDEGLSKEETVELVKWVAETMNTEPRHWKVAKALLPLEAFQGQIEKYNKHRMGQ